jgi:hypothetical protein
VSDIGGERYISDSETDNTEGLEKIKSEQFNILQELNIENFIINNGEVTECTILEPLDFDKILELTSIESLSFDLSSTTEIPDSISGLKKLTTINFLQSDCLTKIPDAILKKPQRIGIQGTSVPPIDLKKYGNITHFIEDGTEKSIIGEHIVGRARIEIRGDEDKKNLLLTVDGLKMKS